MYFFKADQKYSMMKRVDHIILEHTGDDTWNLHLIEMKSSVGVQKWIEVKGKFRASYLVSQAIAAMLEIPLDHTYLYTTYEKECFDTCSETMPVERRVRTGNISPKREWESGRVELNFGEKIPFDHEKVQMTRSTDGLKGNVQMK